MKRKMVMLVIAAVGIVSLAIVGCAPEAAPPEEEEGPPPEEEQEAPPAAPEAERVKWTGTHYMPPGPIWDAAVQVGKDVEEMSGGNFSIEFVAPGAVLTVAETYTGLRDGILECAWAYPGYYIEQLPETIFEGYAPFAFTDMDQMLVYYYERGALALLKESYEEFGLQYVAPLMGGVQGPICAAKPIPNAAAMKGITMRASDVTAEYVTGLGGANVFVPVGESYSLLAAGTVDGVAGVGLVDWYEAGVADIAKYWVMSPPIVPGWTDTFVTDLDAWNELPDEYKAMLEVAAVASYSRLKARQEGMAYEVRKKLVEEGVTLIDWPAEDQGVFAEMALPIVEDRMADTPRCQELYDMLEDYWHEVFG